MNDADRVESALRVLADGAEHDLVALDAGPDELQRACRDFGLELMVADGAVRLGTPLDLLDEAVLRSATGIEDLTVLWQVGSTNDVLGQALRQRGRQRSVLLAEYQSAGRGRRGNRWDSPLARSLSLSMAGSFRQMSRTAALSLAVGVVVAECLNRELADCGSDISVGLKWPNDLWVDERKLGGILVDLVTPALAAVVGVGINVTAVGSSADNLRIALLECGFDGTRNHLAASLVCALAALLEDYPLQGFAAWQARWQQLDLLAGQAVRVVAADGVEQHGIADGVDEAGNLLLRIADGRQLPVGVGEVSLRPLQGIGVRSRS